MTLYAQPVDVYQRMSGDAPTMSDAFGTAITQIIAEVSDDLDREVGLVRGQSGPWSFLADTTATTRVFYAKSGSSLVLIDDCVSVTSVTLSIYGLSPQALVLGTDYALSPPNGAPYTGLLLVAGTWPGFPSVVSVTAAWGYGTSIPARVRGCVVAESIARYQAGRGRLDEPGQTMGMRSAPIGDETLALIDSYGYGAGFLR